MKLAQDRLQMKRPIDKYLLCKQYNKKMVVYKVPRKVPVEIERVSNKKYKKKYLLFHVANHFGQLIFFSRIPCWPHSNISLHRCVNEPFLFGTKQRN